MDAFLNHHDEPAAISRIQFARNVAPLVTVSLPILAVLISIQPMATLAGLAAMSFLGTFFIETGFAMEAHKYAHISQEKLPRMLRWLQRRQWLIAPELHAKHHACKPRFDAEYAAVTGRSNSYLTHAVFRKAERIIYGLTELLTGKGVEPRSWGEPAVRNCDMMIHDQVSTAGGQVAVEYGSHGECAGDQHSPIDGDEGQLQEVPALMPVTQREPAKGQQVRDQATEEEATGHALKSTRLG